MGRRNRWREGTLYLTFDDGPHPEYTPILLDLLASYHIPATFFVVTEFARKNPALIQRMQAEGHLIGFHSASHRSAYLMTPKQTRSDFSLIHQRFTPVFGKEMPLCPGSPGQRGISSGIRAVPHHHGLHRP